MLATGWHFGVRLRWLGKHTLFWPGGGYLLRLMGGIPVDRRNPANLVTDLAEQMRAAPGFALAVPPSGTRARTDYWKSGFYHIARAAGVPVVCGFLDYGQRQAGLGPPASPDG